MKRVIHTIRRKVALPLSRLRAFVANERGAVTILFLVCAGSLMGGLCVALDAIHYGMTQSQMQMALDVAALSAGADLSHYSSTTGTNLTQWQADANAYYSANMPTGAFNLTSPNANFVATVSGTPQTGQLINLSSSDSMPLIAPRFFTAASSHAGSGSSSSSATISVSNAAERLPPSTLELVMVLDNTGSMNDPASGTTGATKISGLRSATTTLLQNLFAQTNGSTFYVGLVPFASTVNVKNALSPSGSWLNPSFAYNPSGVAMTAIGSKAGSGWAGCAVEPRDAGSNLSPEAYSPSDALKFTPYYYNVPPSASGGLAIRTYSSSFQNCSRNPQTTTVTSVPVTLGSGEPNFCGFNLPGTGIGVDYDQNSGSSTTLTQNSDCITQPVTFLTNTQTTLTTAVSKMVAGGSTIIPEGLLWGWRMLSSSWSNNLAGSGNGWVSSNPALPLPETTQGLQRVMIVLTDGENQIGAAGTIPNDLYFNGLSGVGSRSLAAPTVLRTNGSSLANGLTDASELHGNNPEDPSSGNNAGFPDDVNTFQSAVCSAIRQSGVTIFAITFGTSASSSIAQQTMEDCASPGDYFHAPTNATLNTIFQQIEANIGELRLTK